MLSATMTAPAGAAEELRSTFLNRLDARRRCLMLLWHADHLTPGEIGAVLGLAESEVVSEHERIVSLLRALV